MYKIISKFVTRASIITFFLSLTGCATTTWQAAEHNVKTELVSSRHLKLANVEIVEKTSGFSLTGEISSRGGHLIHYLPKGHLDIEIVDSKEHKPHKLTTNFHRIGSASNPRKRYKFSVDVPHVPKAGSVIRVSLHETEQH